MTEQAIAIGTGKEQYYFIKLAKKLGFYIIGFDRNSQSNGVHLCDKFYPISTSDIPQITAILKKYRPTVVIPSPIGKNLNTIGFINDYFGIPSFGLDASISLTDKQKFSMMVKSLDLNYINTYSFSNLDQLFSQAESLPYPIVIKPIDGSGSRGVLLINTIEEMLNYRLHLENHASFFQQGVLVQDYISGTNLGVDGLCLEGNLVDINVRYKFLTDAPFRVEYAYLAPFRLEQAEAISLCNIFQHIIDTLRIQSCVFHADLVLTSQQKFFIIEMSLRPSGMSLSSKLLPFYINKDYSKDFMLFMKAKRHLTSEYLYKKCHDIFLLEYLYNPNFNGRCMLTPTKENICYLKNLKEFSFQYNSVINFMRPTTAYDIINNGYVIFQSSLDEVNVLRTSFYDLFRGVTDER